MKEPVTENNLDIFSTYEERYYPAPFPFDEEERQAAVTQLDMFGKGLKQQGAPNLALYTPGVSAAELEAPVRRSELSPSFSDQSIPLVLTGCPVFKKLVAYATQTFDVKSSFISIVDGDDLVYLAGQSPLYAISIVH